MPTNKIFKDGHRQAQGTGQERQADALLGQRPEGIRRPGLGEDEHQDLRRPEGDRRQDEASAPSARPTWSTSPTPGFEPSGFSTSSRGASTRRRRDAARRR